MNILNKTLAAFFFAGAAAASSAATVTITFDNPIFNGSGYDDVKIFFPSASGHGTTNENVLAGRFQGTASDVVGVPTSIFVDGLNDLYMYCYDVYESINDGQVVKYTINLDGEKDRTRDFIGAVNAVLNAGKSSFDQFAWLHPASGAQGAAIQLGIWESLYEASGWDIASGSFRATGLDTTTSSWLNSFLGQIDSSASIDKKYVMTLEAAGAQDMIAGDPPAAVPEPASIALLGLGLAAIAVTRKRKA